MKTFYLTDKGRVRDHNEDSVTIITNSSNETLLAIADGMGGHKAGEVASNIAIKYLEDTFLTKNASLSKEEAIEYLQTAAAKINVSLFNYSEQFPESKGLGTTLVMALVTKEYILMGNIGDSAGYVLKNDKLYKVTEDHTLVDLLVQSGALKKEDEYYRSNKNILMKVLGASTEVNIDVFDVDTKDLKGIFLCSDGLTNMVTKDQINQVLINDESIEEQVIRLIRKSNNRGGKDNISIAYLTCEGGEIL